MNIKLSLQKNHVPDKELLLAHAIHKSREFVVAHPEYILSLVERMKFWWYVWKRKKGIPLAYITGHKAFYGLDFFVNKHTLVPRPDTEVLVEKILQLFSPYKGELEGVVSKENIVLVDVGTGSGCIPISILKSYKPTNVPTYATDISEGALKVAKQNATHHNVDITFLQGNLLEPIIERNFFIDNCSLFITANLPYLTEDQFQKEPSIQHEPKSALVADKQGLALYEELLGQIKSLFFNLNSSIFVYFEIDPTQTKGITALVKKYFPSTSVGVTKDLAGHNRVVSFKIKKEN